MKENNRPLEHPVINRLFQMLDYSTCNFRAIDAIKYNLDENGFVELPEGDKWEIEPGCKYYVVKNHSAIFAFVAGTAPVESAGFRIISSHSDSPCFKLKPNCEIYGDGGVVSLNVEKYGGGILYTWFDRPLSVSGRIMLRGYDAFHPEEYVIDLRMPVATIPHLAIHFNRSVNEGNPLSVQKDMKPVLGYYTQEEIAQFKSNGGVIRHLIAQHINRNPEQFFNIRDQFSPAANMRLNNEVSPQDILDYELCLYPAEEPSLVGANLEYFQSARIDDLSMAFASLEAMLATCNTPCDATRVIAIFDNEETGSGTKQGAASPVLRHIAERVCICTGSNSQGIYMALANSFMISADDAHAWHPNYNEKYDPTNHPVMGGGPVVKINANCKYMTDARGATVFKSLCEEAEVNCQYFVNHADVAGGSTLGNISSSQLDIDGVDVGCAIWAMHSARETASVSDHLDMVKVLTTFLK
ncbi:MAG: M18 family aminopeptidase [Candidatus Amulumruptor caecigallinarius]|nr:M18 family aminopeptidase [Candidatus Amulumruptor caecigallinarius]